MDDESYPSLYPSMNDSSCYNSERIASCQSSVQLVSICKQTLEAGSDSTQAMPKSSSESSHEQPICATSSTRSCPREAAVRFSEKVEEEEAERDDVLTASMSCRLVRYEELLQKILAKQDRQEELISRLLHKSTKGKTNGLVGPMRSTTGSSVPVMNVPSTMSAQRSMGWWNRLKYANFKGWSATSSMTQEESTPAPRTLISPLGRTKPKRMAEWETCVGDFAEEDSPRSLRQLIQDIVHSNLFEILFIAMAILSAIIIGVQVEVTAEDPKAEKPPTWLFVLDLCLTGAFLIEFALRFVADGIFMFSSVDWVWNCLDILILLVSAVEVCLSTIEAVQGTGGFDLGSVRIIRIIRITRLIRVIRITRVVRFFEKFRILVYSIVCTIRALLWSMLLLIIMIYLFGILFTEAVSVHRAVQADNAEPPENSPDTQILIHYFGTLFRSMSTLFMSITDGLDWGAATEELGKIHIVWRLCYSLYVAFATFAVLNVMTGFFCQTAIENAERDNDLVIHNMILNKQWYIQQIKDLFEKIDARKSGCITAKEFESKLYNEEVQAYFSSLDMDISDAWTLFRLLDLDDNHDVDVDEFITGCMRLRGPAKAVDIAKMMSDNKNMKKRIATIVKTVEGNARLLVETQETLRGMVAEQSPDKATSFHDLTEELASW